MTICDFCKNPVISKDGYQYYEPTIDICCRATGISLVSLDLCSKCLKDMLDRIKQAKRKEVK